MLGLSHGFGSQLTEKMGRPPFLHRLGLTQLTSHCVCFWNLWFVPHSSTNRINWGTKEKMSWNIITSLTSKGSCDLSSVSFMPLIPTLKAVVVIPGLSLTLTLYNSFHGHLLSHSITSHINPKHRRYTNSTLFNPFFIFWNSVTYTDKTMEHTEVHLLHRADVTKD